MSHPFPPGTRVLTPSGPGAVHYVRMAPPTFSEPDAVSVILDSQTHRPNYAGTIFLPTDVKVQAPTETRQKLPTVGLVAEYHELGWQPWHNQIDADVARESACECCGQTSCHFVGFQSKGTRIAIQVCNRCGHEQEF